MLPLRVPDRKAGAESLLRSDAVQLFVERARLQKPDFYGDRSVMHRPSPSCAPGSTAFRWRWSWRPRECARCRSSEINERLHDRFKLLTGGSRVALERQQTLRALVNWSYDLLQENEQIVLDRLSVFVGGFDLAAAEAVCGADPVAPDRCRSIW